MCGVISWVMPTPFVVPTINHYILWFMMLRNNKDVEQDRLFPEMVTMYMVFCMGTLRVLKVRVLNDIYKYSTVEKHANELEQTD